MDLKTFEKFGVSLWVPKIATSSCEKATFLMARGLSWAPFQKCPKGASLLYGKLEFVISKTWRNLKIASLNCETRVWTTFNLIILDQLDLKFGVSLWISKTSRSLE